MFALLRTTVPRFTALCGRHRTVVSVGLQIRRHQGTTASRRPSENLNVGHSLFLSQGAKAAKWVDVSNTNGQDGEHSHEEDYDSLTDGKGKLSPTSSHLFKLIVPIDRLRAKSDNQNGEPPTVFLLHPSQPLSHIGRLVAASLAPSTPTATFRCTSPKGLTLEWSDSTDLGDFIRDAARAREFELHMQTGSDHKILQIEVPTFADRTRFLRRRLRWTEGELRTMETLKRQCDVEAHRGARKMAVGGLAMLVTYWGAVARLTFWDLGWDIMEPVTYLSGLSMVIAGYMWFLYQGREVSYSSVLDRSISTRQQALYRSHGFDIERWADLISEQKNLRKEISKIAEDYDERRWKEGDEERKEKEALASKEVTKVRSAARKAEDTSD